MTTHISIDTYEDTLKKLNFLNVNYLNPERVNKCIENNFNDCEEKSRTNLMGYAIFLKGLLILNVLPPYIIWKYVVAT